jgi:hypothetical protein
MILDFGFWILDWPANTSVPAALNRRRSPAVSPFVGCHGTQCRAQFKNELSQRNPKSKIQNPKSFGEVQP